MKSIWVELSKVCDLLLLLASPVLTDDLSGTKVAMLHMANRGKGVIVNTASIAGFAALLYEKGSVVNTRINMLIRLLSQRDIDAYCASKHAVVGWTRSLESLKDICNVRVNAGNVNLRCSIHARD